ncbi:hypothetical protein [Nocardioides sp.]|uniref:hypothetical protein n=1 Tax=Nocardioides sp. TaxID=35761 RepID=UPI0026016B30|nr:hypothetical protein [Nocardioides sp.]
MTSRAARAGLTVVRQVRSVLHPASDRPAEPGSTASGWLAVTVLCDPSDLADTPLPAPLAELGDDVEVRLTPAPGDKGTELAVRLRERGTSGGERGRLTGSDLTSDLRSALRKAKQLIEVGEVLVVDPAPHGRRTATPGGVLLEAWTKVAPKAGVR